VKETMGLDDIATFRAQWINVLGKDADMLKPDNDDEWLALWHLEQRRLDGEDKSKKDVLAEILEREYAKYLREHPKQRNISRRDWLHLATVTQAGGDQRALWFFNRMMSSEFPFCNNYGSRSGFYAIDLASDLKLFGTKKQPTIYNYMCRFKNGEYSHVSGEDSSGDEGEQLEQSPRRGKRANDVTPKVHYDDDDDGQPGKAKVTKVDNLRTPSTNGFQAKSTSPPPQRKSTDGVSDVLQLVTESEKEQEGDFFFDTITSSTLDAFSRRDFATNVNDMKGQIQSLNETVATLQETVKTMQAIINTKMKESSEHVTTLHANDETMQKLLQDIINKTNHRFLTMENFIKNINI